MKSAKRRKGGHPSSRTLALFSRGDLKWFGQWQIGRHVGKCSYCDGQVTRFRSARSELRREADTQTLTGFEAIADWSRLEREMEGNIAVGFAAGRCIQKIGRGRTFAVRGAWVVAVLALLFIAAWFTNVPSEQRVHLAASLRRSVGIEVPQITASVLETTPEGIAVRTQGATLTILHPPAAVVSLAGTSSLGARFVDEESGEVTITNVYGQ